MAAKTISVSWSKSQGQYRKYVGYQLGRNSKPQPKCWYLGTDEREAIQRAVELVAEWNRLKLAKATVWPLKAAGGQSGEDNKERKDDFVDADAMRVGEVCDLFLLSLRRLAESRQRSWSLVHSTEQRLWWVKRALGVHAPMSSLGEREIQRAVLFLVRRPTSRIPNHHKATPGPLAIKTVVNCVRQMKSVLTWYEEMNELVVGSSGGLPPGRTKREKGCTDVGPHSPDQSMKTSR